MLWHNNYFYIFYYRDWQAAETHKLASWQLNYALKSQSIIQVITNFIIVLWVHMTKKRRHSTAICAKLHQQLRNISRSIFPLFLRCQLPSPCFLLCSVTLSLPPTLCFLEQLLPWSRYLSLFLTLPRRTPPTSSLFPFFSQVMWVLCAVKSSDWLCFYFYLNISLLASAVKWLFFTTVEIGWGHLLLCILSCLSSKFVSLSNKIIFDLQCLHSLSVLPWAKVLVVDLDDHVQTTMDVSYINLPNKYIDTCPSSVHTPCTHPHVHIRMKKTISWHEVLRKKMMPGKHIRKMMIMILCKAKMYEFVPISLTQDFH